MDDLEKRYTQFMTMTLPGQPFSMHMGTSTLVYDLWEEVKRLRRFETTTTIGPLIREDEGTPA